MSAILVVDDNEANRELARAALEDEGHRVILAGNAAEAILAFERERPDCILLDVRMPEVDGFTACERIRALPGGPETPILFLTALRDVDTFARLADVGREVPAVAADRTRFVQILTNFGSNAIKYNLPAGRCVRSIPKPSSWTSTCPE